MSKLCIHCGGAIKGKPKPTNMGFAHGKCDRKAKRKVNFDHKKFLRG